MQDSTPQPPTKQCTKCGETKPATTEFFSRGNSRKDGLNGWCKICTSEYQREWYESNKEKISEQKREKDRKYYETHKEKKREYDREYRTANAEKISEREREYYTANKEKISEQQREYLQTPRGKEVKRTQNQRRRARKVSAPIGLPFDEKLQLKRQKNRCYYCGCRLDQYHVDHVIPLSRGGSDGSENKVLACPTCNLSKGSKLPSEWAEGGRLL